MKLRYSKILVPYDGSNYAEKALNDALNIAKFVKGSEIIIINVMEEILTPLVIFPSRVRHYKTGEDTTLSTYFRDLQTDMRYKTTETLEKIRQKYETQSKLEQWFLLVNLQIKLWNLQIGRMWIS